MKNVKATRVEAVKAIRNLYIALVLVVIAYGLTIGFITDAKTKWLLLGVITLLLGMLIGFMISFYTIPKVEMEEDEEHYYLYFRNKKKNAVINKKDVVAVSAICNYGNFKQYDYGTLVIAMMKDNYALPYVAHVKEVSDSMDSMEKQYEAKHGHKTENKDK